MKVVRLGVLTNVTMGIALLEYVIRCILEVGTEISEKCAVLT